jgi:hypothetical protein
MGGHPAPQPLGLGFLVPWWFTLHFVLNSVPRFFRVVVFINSFPVGV